MGVIRFVELIGVCVKFVAIGFAILSESLIRQIIGLRWFYFLEKNQFIYIY